MANSSRLGWRRFLRMRLLTVMILVTVVAFFMARRVRQAHHQRVAVKAVLACGGTVIYDWDNRDQKLYSLNYDAQPPGPKWLRSLIGDAYFQKVIAIEPGYGGVVGERAGVTHVRPVMSIGVLIPHWSVKGKPKALPQMIHAISKLKYLRRLKLSNARITDADLKPLSRLKQLKELDLSHTDITGEGLVYLRRLKSLQKLVLKYSFVSDACLTHIGDLRGLQYLDLSATQVHGRRLEHLARLSKLRELDLSYTVLEAEAPLALAKLTSVRKLTMRGYHLAYHPLSYWSFEPEKGDRALHAAALKSLAKMDNLTALDLQASRVGVKAVQSFQRSRPNVNLFKVSGKPPEPAPAKVQPPPAKIESVAKDPNNPFGA